MCIGLEGLAVHDALGNLEIFSNARLQDISALSSVLRCNKAGTSAITPADAVVGAIEVSVSLQSSMRCLLSTVTQVAHPHYKTTSTAVEKSEVTTDTIWQTLVISSMSDLHCYGTGVPLHHGLLSVPRRNRVFGCLPVPSRHGFGARSTGRCTCGGSAASAKSN